MLAAQFLNVVLEENDSKNERKSDASCEEMDVAEVKSEISENDESQNLFSQLLSELDIKSTLAKILVDECTIEPVNMANKRDRPVLSFEAYVTPIYDIPAKKTKLNNEVELLESVEAVYSDNEGPNDFQGGNLILNCPLCNRVFNRNCSLALHMKSHEAAGEEFAHYQCHFCSQSFLHKALLKAHLSECLSSKGWITENPQDSNVENSRKYECQFCHRTYTQKSVLKKHLVVHTGERERCEICGAGFSQRSSLVRHTKRIHGIYHTPLSAATAASATQVTHSPLHKTPILTTVLSGVTHPRFGTPLIVGIPLSQYQGGKFRGTHLQTAISSQIAAGNSALSHLLKIDNKPSGAALIKLGPGGAVLEKIHPSNSNPPTPQHTLQNVQIGEKPILVGPSATIIKVASGGAVIEKIPHKNSEKECASNPSNQNNSKNGPPHLGETNHFIKESNVTLKKILNESNFESSDEKVSSGVKDESKTVVEMDTKNENTFELMNSKDDKSPDKTDSLSDD